MLNQGQKVGVIVTAVTAVGLTLWGVMSRESGAHVAPLSASPYDQELIAIDKAALSRAYSNQVKALFAIWMKDPTDQPRRALNGVNQARKAYIDAMTEIEKRERK